MTPRHRMVDRVGRPPTVVALLLAVVALASTTVSAGSSAGASFTAQASTEAAVVASASLPQLTGVAAERDPDGRVEVTWDELGFRPELATGYRVERTVDGVTTVLDGGDGMIGAETSRPPLAIGAASVTSIDTGQAASCAIAAAELYCWGSFDVYTEPPSSPVRMAGLLEGLSVTAVSLGRYFGCAIADGEAYCWGMGAAGELGNGATSHSALPVKVGGLLAGKTVTDISAGRERACAVADARAYCWGNGQHGALGHGSTAGSSSPVAVGGVLADAEVSDISTGGVGVTCAAAEGSAYCWGSNYSGMLGTGTTTPSLTPVPVSTAGVLGGRTVTEVVVGERHGCAIADSRAYCWGENTYGQLGDGTTTASYVPVAVDTGGALAGRAVSSLDAGYLSNCVIADSAAYCWGRNNASILGDGTTASTRPSPVAAGAVPGAVTSLTIANNHSCALAEGIVLCWGLGADGALGTGSDTSRTVPTPVDTSGDLAVAECEPDWRPLRDPLRCGVPLDAEHPGFIDELRAPGILREASQLSVGDYHSCAVAGGVAVCWGMNTSSQLGDGDNIHRSTPVEVRGALVGRTVTAISAAQSHSCAIADGAAYCWGHGTSGQLGHGVAASSPVPIAVGGPLAGKTVTDISAGYAQSCAVADGVAYCWGSRNGGALGDGSTSGSVASPQAVGGLLSGLTVTRVVTAQALGCAIAHPHAAPHDTTVYCWGDGRRGSLGNGTSGASHVPRAVTMTGALAGRTVTHLSADDGFLGTEPTVCVVADADPFCWGAGTYGQLGSGAASDSAVPVAVTTGGAISAGTTTAITVGNRATCAIADGTPSCWGQRAGGSHTPSVVDTTGLLDGTESLSIGFGGSHGCVVADARVYCWGGENGRPLLGDGSSGPSATLVPVDTSGVLSAGGCLPGWLALELGVCSPGPGNVVSYRVAFEKLGWWAPPAETSAVWTEAG